MNRNQSTYCQSCKHCVFQPNKAAFCGLTENAPSFSQYCPDLAWDKEKHKQAERKLHLKRKLYKQSSTKSYAAKPWKPRIPAEPRVAFLSKGAIVDAPLGMLMMIACAATLIFIHTSWVYIWLVAVFLALPNLYILFLSRQLPYKKAITFDKEGIEAHTKGTKFYWNDIRFLGVWESFDRDGEQHNTSLAIYIYGKAEPELVSLRKCKEGARCIVSWAEAYRPLWEKQPDFPLKTAPDNLEQRIKAVVKSPRLASYHSKRFVNRKQRLEVSRRFGVK